MVLGLRVTREWATTLLQHNPQPADFFAARGVHTLLRKLAAELRSTAHTQEAARVQVNDRRPILRRGMRLGLTGLGLTVLFLGVSAAAADPSADGSSPPPYLAESTRQMAARLAALADAFEQRTIAAKAKYFRANVPANIPVYRQRLLALRDPQRRVNVRYALARELLWSGRTDEAKVVLERALANLPDEGSGPASGLAETTALLRHWLAVTYLRL